MTHCVSGSTSFSKVSTSSFNRNDSSSAKNSGTSPFEFCGTASVPKPGTWLSTLASSHKARGKVKRDQGRP